MATEIIRQSPRIAIKDGTLYEPVFIVINKKIYSVNDWHEALKMLMYTYCFKADKLQLLHYSSVFPVLTTESTRMTFLVCGRQ